MHMCTLSGLAPLALLAPWVPGCFPWVPVSEHVWWRVEEHDCFISLPTRCTAKSIGSETPQEGPKTQ